MTGGLPPRREELGSITWRNWTTMRSIYVINGMLAIIASYHKSQWRIGSRPVARFLPYAVGSLLLKYLIFVPSFANFSSAAARPAPDPRFSLHA